MLCYTDESTGGMEGGVGREREEGETLGISGSRERERQRDMHFGCLRKKERIKE